MLPATDWLDQKNIPPSATMTEVEGRSTSTPPPILTSAPSSPPYAVSLSNTLCQVLPPYVACNEDLLNGLSADDEVEPHHVVEAGLLDADRVDVEVRQVDLVGIDDPPRSPR